MCNNNIKAFLFDLGNVIIPFDNYIAASKIKNYTDKSVDEIYNIIFDSSIVKQFSEGKIEPVNFFNELKEIIKLNSKITYEEFESIWNSIFIKEDKKMCQLIRKFKKNYDVAIISNINKIHYEYIMKNFDIFQQIKKRILSYKVGVNKPDPEIYKEAFKVIKAEPEDTIYIDDRLDLIQESKKLGLNSIQYRGYDRLIKDLERFGISL